MARAKLLLGLVVLASLLMVKAEAQVKVDQPLLEAELFADQRKKSKQQYQAAAKDFHALFNQPSFQRNFSNWQETIEKFSRIVADFPNFIEAPRALYNIGQLNDELYHRRNNDAFLARANLAYSSLVASYPTVNLADDALVKLARNYGEHLANHERAKQVLEKFFAEYPNSELVSEAQALLAALNPQVRLAEPEKKAPPPSQQAPVVKPKPGSDKVVIKSLNQHSAKDWSRVLLTVSAATNYKYATIKDSASGGYKFYIDILNSALSGDLPINFVADDILENVRVAQFNPTTVRTVLDLKTNSKVQVYKFENEDEHKIVIDLLPDADLPATIEEHAHPHLPTKPQPDKPPSTKPPTETPFFGPNGDVSIAQALGLKVRRIILDPGHGGRDPGAVAFGLLEKILPCGFRYWFEKF